MAMNEHEIALVTDAIKGDIKAFEELYTHYYGKIFALARMTVKNETDAEDILQQTFINAWQSLSSLDNPEAFNTWLQKITLNLSYNLLRKKNMAILTDIEGDTEEIIEDASDDFIPSMYAERDDLRLRLGKIIDGLSEIQKQTVVLYYFNEQKVEEISYIMDCSVGTVKKRLFLARKAIRTEIEEEERKSGEKFYGIAGIPMLPLGELLCSHIESQLLAADAYTSILASIIESISSQGTAIGDGVAADSIAAESGAESGAAESVAATTTSAVKGSFLGTKAILIAVIAAVVIGLGIGTVLLIGNLSSDNADLSDDAETSHISDSTENPDSDEHVDTPQEPTPQPSPPPCEHDWLAADCNNPETCLECGETKGTVLEHEWKDANYQEPETCILCMETKGEPLTPGFELHGLSVNTTFGGRRPYVSVAANKDRRGTLHETIGEITLQQVHTSNSFRDDTAISDYEFIYVTLGLKFSDSVAWDHGASWAFGFFDYYTFDPTEKGVDLSEAEESEIPGFVLGPEFTNYYGEDKDIYINFSQEPVWSMGSQSLTVTFRIVFSVPKGYDGLMIRFTNAKLYYHSEEFLSIKKEDLTAGDLIDDDTLFFRPVK